MSAAPSSPLNIVRALFSVSGRQVHTLWIIAAMVWEIESLIINNMDQACWCLCFKTEDKEGKCGLDSDGRAV